MLVLKKSLQSIDYNTAIKIFDNILEGYADEYKDDSLNREQIIKKINEIESRGRYTH